jgi:hypothetical protein
MDMGHEVGAIRQTQDSKRHTQRHSEPKQSDIVFDKSVFSNIFHKDIRRVYIYKKSERLASALYLIIPAFRDALALKAKAESTALALTEAASLPPGVFRDALSRELLAVSSVLSIARVGGLLSAMNVELIAREVQMLLADLAAYEEPQLSLSYTPTLATLVRQAPAMTLSDGTPRMPVPRDRTKSIVRAEKGHTSERKQSILSFIGERGTVSIKDISLAIRNVSEKTIQRELQALIETGRVERQGERRWSVYSIAGP